MRNTLVLSVRPVFADQILSGSKTVELRRVRPHVSIGTQVLIYSSSPTKALVATACVRGVDVGTVEAQWPLVCEAAGISERDYLAYFQGRESAVAIWLAQVRPLATRLELAELRRRWPWFRPPQSYCFVGASFEQPIPRLAPRLASGAGAASGAG